MQAVPIQRRGRRLSPVLFRRDGRSSCRHLWDATGQAAIKVRLSSAFIFTVSWSLAWNISFRWAYTDNGSLIGLNISHPKAVGTGERRLSSLAYASMPGTAEPILEELKFPDNTHLCAFLLHSAFIRTCGCSSSSKNQKPSTLTRHLREDSPMVLIHSHHFLFTISPVGSKHTSSAYSALAVDVRISRLRPLNL